MNTGKAKGIWLYRWPENISKPCVGKQPKNKARNGEPRNNWMRQQYRKDKENKVEVVLRSLNLKKTCHFSRLLTYLYLFQNYLYCIKNYLSASAPYIYICQVNKQGFGSLKLAAKLRRQFQNWQLKTALSKQCSPGWCFTAVSRLLVPSLGLASSTGSRGGGSTPCPISCPHHLHSKQLVLLTWPQTLAILPCLLFPPKPTDICLAGHPYIKK